MFEVYGRSKAYFHKHKLQNKNMKLSKIFVKIHINAGLVPQFNFNLNNNGINVISFYRDEALIMEQSHKCH